MDHKLSPSISKPRTCLYLHFINIFELFKHANYVFTADTDFWKLRLEKDTGMLLYAWKSIYLPYYC